MSGNIPHFYPTRRLPKQPSLEQLRKQAKDLLEQYRAADPAAVAEVQQFERRPDPAAFALHDAQRVLARAYGYESWPKLKAFVDGANVARLAEAVQAGDVAQVRVLLSARPELVAMDMADNDEHRALHLRGFAPRRSDGELADGSRRRCAQGHLPTPRRDFRFRHRQRSRLHGHRRRHRGRGTATPRGDELPERHDLTGAGPNQPAPSDKATMQRGHPPACRRMRP